MVTSYGYILLSRKIIESEIWDKPPLYIKVWIWLLRSAQHKEYKGLKRGQLFCTITEIQRAVSWKVGYRTVYPTKDQIYQIIDWLRRAHERGNESNDSPTMIATTKATQGMVITISRYCYYQDAKNYESNTESNNETDTKPEREQQLPNNINKNDKNDKNKRIKDIGEFVASLTPSEKLREAISDWIDMRIKNKKPPTEKAIELAYTKVRKMASTEDEAVAIFNQSTLNNWSGVFPIKE